MKKKKLLKLNKKQRVKDYKKKQQKTKQFSEKIKMCFALNTDFDYSHGIISKIADAA